MTIPSLKLNSLHSILIVCTGNICRSPMAEGLLKSILPEDPNSRPVIHSAGTHAMAGLPAEPYAINALEKYGVDISAHRSRPLDLTMMKKADLILVMAQQHLYFIENSMKGESINVHMLCDDEAFGANADVPDPYGGSLRTYRECAHMIYGCLQRVVIHLIGNSDSETKPGTVS